MSRCFPFPPPGYEKKARTDDVDLLKKEKRREKKHKKEKKEKEKREGKEKKEKDRSEGKHREKKDRKEKHRDKKKEKEKDRDKEKEKDKSGTSDEKKLSGQSEGPNGKTLGQSEKDREKGKNSSSDDKRLSGQFVGDNGDKLNQNSRLAEETKNSKFVQELGRRIRDGDRGIGNQLVEKFISTGQKKDEGVVRLVGKDVGNWAEGKEKNKDKKGEDRRTDEKKNKDKKGEDRRTDEEGSRDEAKFSGNSILQNVPAFVQGKFDGIPRPPEKIEKVEGKDKTKKKEGDDKQGDKRRDKDREKKSQGKDKDKDKEKKKEEKAKEKSAQKIAEQDRFKGEKNGATGTHSNTISDLAKDSNIGAVIEENLRKRKDPEANGFFHATDIRPNKLPRLISSHSSHPLIENGMVLEPCQTPVKLTSDWQEVASNPTVEKKHKVNGIIEAPPISIPSRKHSSVAPVQADKVTKTSAKPPHPDTKYLSQILSVPKMEEWSEFDDQEWLFSSDETRLKEPKEVSVAIETPQVWDVAMQIDSADVCALPYVIPY